MIINNYPKRRICKQIFMYLIINRADRDYEMGPTTEMMVNDFDDERTLDEEEALEGSEDSHNELSNLQKV